MGYTPRETLPRSGGSRTIVVLLCGGDKREQDAHIRGQWSYGKGTEIGKSPIRGKELTASHCARLIAELRADPKLAAEYLNAAAEDGDPPHKQKKGRVDPQMNISDAVVRFLQTVPFFAGLDSHALETIAARCQSKPLQAGQLVFTEGDLCRHLYILESGCVKFYRASAEGREQILKIFDRQGDSFCIPSAFRTGKHIVSARAAAKTRLHVLDVDTLNRLTLEHPSMALKLVATAGEHMTHLVNLAEDLSLKTATARLAKYFSELAEAEGAEQGKEIRLARDRLPEEELAAMLGTVRVHVSRSLKNLVRAGAIDLDRRFILIRDLTVLKQISNGSSGPR